MTDLVSISLDVGRPGHLARSYPVAWCKSGGVIALSGGLAGFCQAATAGSPTSEPSLKGAMVSSVM